MSCSCLSRSRSLAVCCNVLQCVAVCCSVLQCVAVCSSVLQCVAVCCSVLQVAGRVVPVSLTLQVSYESIQRPLPPEESYFLAKEPYIRQPYHTSILDTPGLSHVYPTRPIFSLIHPTFWPKSPIVDKRT